MTSGPTRPRVNKTNKIKLSDNSLEISVFSELEEKELQYYLHLLSFKPFNKYFLSKLQYFLSEEDSKATQKLSELIDKIDKKLLQDLSFRLLDAPKLWGRFINQLLLGKVDDDSIQFLSALYGVKDTNKYKVWLKKSLALYDEINFIKNNFATANMGLVFIIVKNIVGNRNVSIPQEDLIQEGYFGLVRAIEKFDYTKGLKFSTYSTWWIRHAAQRYIQDHDALIRVPAHTDEIRNKVKEFKKNFQDEYGRLPLDNEISKGTGISLLSIATVVEPHKIVSVDEEISSDEDDFCLQLEDKNQNILQSLFNKNDLDKLLSVIDLLSPVEKKIIYGRYGFLGDEMTLAEVGKELNLSRERVRQIQDKTIDKIRELFELPSVMG